MEQVKTQLQQLRPELPINFVTLPQGHSMNDMWLNYGVDGIVELLKDTTKEKSI